MGIKHFLFPAHFIGSKIILSGVMTVFTFGRLIALVDEAGKIVWRDRTVPKFFIEYLIEYPPLDEKIARWN